MEVSNSSDHISDYLHFLRERGEHEDNSMLATESRLKGFREYWQRATGCDVERMTGKTAQGYVTFLLGERKLGKLSARQHLSTVRTFWAWLCVEDIARWNPFRELPVIRAKRAYKPEPLSETELLAFLEAEERPDYRAMWETYAGTGARLNEVRKLFHKDVDLDAGEITCRVKGGEIKTINLTERAVEYLRAYFGDQVHHPESPVWPALYRGRRRGKAPRVFIADETMRLRMLTISARAGLNPGRMRTHLFRHTFATDLLALTQNMKKVQEALGHARMSTTQDYVQVQKSEVRDLVRLRGRKMGVGAVGA